MSTLLGLHVNHLHTIPNCEEEIEKVKTLLKMMFFGTELSAERCLFKPEHVFGVMVVVLLTNEERESMWTIWFIHS